MARSIRLPKIADKRNTSVLAFNTKAEEKANCALKAITAVTRKQFAKGGGLSHLFGR